MKSLFQLFSRNESAIPHIACPIPMPTPMIPPVEPIPTTPQIRFEPTPIDNTFPKECPSPTTIKHIVISGGGESGFSFYSALRDSNKAGFWNIENIESVYGTSVGSIFAIMIVLLHQFDWNIYDDFISKRPWHHVFEINVNTIIQSIHQKGLLGIKTVEDIFLPLFGALDIPLDITMADFHKITGIDLHLITVEISNLELVDICHTNYPEWKVVDAVYCSACLPILFIPHTINNRMYIDGGTLSNYPVKQCLATGANPDEILGLNRVYTGLRKSPKIDTMVDYLLYIIGRLHSKVVIPPSPLKNQIELYSDERFVSIYNVYNSCSDCVYRKQLLDEGVAAWRTFYAKTYLTPEEPTDTDEVPDVNV